MILTGCTKKPYLWIQKKSIPKESKIEVFVCWGNKTKIGKEIKRLTDNFNLSITDGLKVSLSSIDDVNLYEQELRKKIATNELPDLFISFWNENDPYLEQSSALLDFSALDSKGKKIVEKHSNLFESSKNSMRYLCFDEPTMYLFVNSEINFAGLETNDRINKGELFDLLTDSIKYNHKTHYETDALSDDSLDFLFYLLAQRQVFNYDSQQDWSELLTEWKDYIIPFSMVRFLESGLYQEVSYEKVFYIDTMDHFIQKSENASRYIFFPLNSANNSVLSGNKRCWSAKVQNDPRNQARIIDYLNFIFDETSSIFAENEADQAMVELGSRVLPPVVHEEYRKILESLKRDEISVDQAAGEFLSIYQKNKEY